MEEKLFHPLDIAAGVDLPKELDYPFLYDPHPLAILAAENLQNELITRHFNHNFGLDGNDKGLVIGKMFGVLVVQTASGKLGYLQAFSGKLAESNLHEGFVPPVFDLLDTTGFFLEEEQSINRLNKLIEEKENSSLRQEIHTATQAAIEALDNELQQLKSHFKAEKKLRQQQRESLEQAYPELSAEREEALEELRKISVGQSFFLKKETKRIQQLKNLQLAKRDEFEQAIQLLKSERAARSFELQQRIFKSYYFLNSKGETENLLNIFRGTSQIEPPAGAGECCAPKLFHYAFKSQLKPIALAEFWWGQSPSSEVRKHLGYYPACRGKCEPILGFMLQGISVAANPLENLKFDDLDLPVIYEDDDLIAVNKPAEFLSVPGITIKDSVYTRIQKMRPEISGPIIIHRLDMSTSGILLLAKNKHAHKLLQRQFIRHKIKKTYQALLVGSLEQHTGKIILPLRVDLDDRPRQLVCYEHGKYAETDYSVIGQEKINDQLCTRLLFYPKTGRTHQLRVHSAHRDGLACPILGDDLYGTKSDRLYLHAYQLTFYHPSTNEAITLTAEPNF